MLEEAAEDVKKEGGSESFDSQSLSEKGKRLLMKEWLQYLLDTNRMPDILQWVNKNDGLFRIKWVHKATENWSVSSDAILFKEWCMHTGKYDPKQENPRRWKANFRCALNSLPDVIIVRELCVKKGKDAYRVFRILPEKLPEKVKEKQEQARKRRKLDVPKRQSHGQGGKCELAVAGDDCSTARGNPDSSDGEDDSTTDDSSGDDANTAVHVTPQNLTRSYQPNDNFNGMDALCTAALLMGDMAATMAEPAASTTVLREVTASSLHSDIVTYYRPVPDKSKMSTGVIDQGAAQQQDWHATPGGSQNDAHKPPMVTFGDSGAVSPGQHNSLLSVPPHSAEPLVPLVSARYKGITLTAGLNPNGSTQVSNTFIQNSCARPAVVVTTTCVVPAYRSGQASQSSLTTQRQLPPPQVVYLQHLPKAGQHIVHVTKRAGSVPHSCAASTVAPLLLNAQGKPVLQHTAMLSSPPCCSSVTTFLPLLASGPQAAGVNEQHHLPQFSKRDCEASLSSKVVSVSCVAAPGTHVVVSTSDCHGAGAAQVLADIKQRIIHSDRGDPHIVTTSMKSGVNILLAAPCSQQTELTTSSAPTSAIMSADHMQSAAGATESCHMASEVSRQCDGDPVLRHVNSSELPSASSLLQALKAAGASNNYAQLKQSVCSADYSHLGFEAIKTSRWIRLVRMRDLDIPSVEVSVTICEDLAAVVVAAEKRINAGHELWDGLPQTFTCLGDVEALLHRLSEFSCCVGFNADVAGLAAMWQPQDEALIGCEANVKHSSDTDVPPNDLQAKLVHSDPCAILARGPPGSRCRGCNALLTSRSGRIACASSLSGGSSCSDGKSLGPLAEASTQGRNNKLPAVQLDGLARVTGCT